MFIELEKSDRLTHPRPAKRGEKVQVYGNLTNGKVSLKADRWVIGHARRVFLRNVEFTVNEKGRQSVLRRQKRLVHAFAIGTIEYANDEFRLLNFSEQIRYNPFRAGHFTRTDGSAIWSAASCLVVADKGEDGTPFIYILSEPEIEIIS